MCIRRLGLALDVDEDRARPATDQQDELERLHGIGRMLGLDHSISTIRAGVPVDDVIG